METARSKTMIEEALNRAANFILFSGLDYIKFDSLTQCFPSSLNIDEVKNALKSDSLERFSFLDEGEEDFSVGLAYTSKEDAHLQQGVELWKTSMVNYLDDLSGPVDLSKLAIEVHRPKDLPRTVRIKDVVRSDMGRRFYLAGPADRLTVVRTVSPIEMEQSKELWRYKVAKFLSAQTKSVTLSAVGANVDKPPRLGNSVKLIDVLRTDPVQRFELDNSNYVSNNSNGSNGISNSSPCTVSLILTEKRKEELCEEWRCNIATYIHSLEHDPNLSEIGSAVHRPPSLVSKPMITLQTVLSTDPMNRFKLYGKVNNVRAKLIHRRTLASTRNKRIITTSVSNHEANDSEWTTVSNRKAATNATNATTSSATVADIVVPATDFKTVLLSTSHVSNPSIGPTTVRWSAPKTITAAATSSSAEAAVGTSIAATSGSRFKTSGTNSAFTQQQLQLQQHHFNSRAAAMMEPVAEEHQQYYYQQQHYRFDPIMITNDIAADNNNNNPTRSRELLLLQQQQRPRQSSFCSSITSDGSSDMLPHCVTTTAPAALTTATTIMARNNNNTTTTIEKDDDSYDEDLVAAATGGASGSWNDCLSYKAAALGSVSAATLAAPTATSTNYHDSFGYGRVKGSRSRLTSSDCIGSNNTNTRIAANTMTTNNLGNPYSVLFDIPTVNYSPHLYSTCSSSTTATSSTTAAGTTACSSTTTPSPLLSVSPSAAALLHSDSPYLWGGGYHLADCANSNSNNSNALNAASTVLVNDATNSVYSEPETTIASMNGNNSTSNHTGNNNSGSSSSSNYHYGINGNHHNINNNRKIKDWFIVIFDGFAPELVNELSSALCEEGFISVQDLLIAESKEQLSFEYLKQFGFKMGHYNRLMTSLTVASKFNTIV